MMVKIYYGKIVEYYRETYHVSFRPIFSKELIFKIISEIIYAV